LVHLGAPKINDGQKPHISLLFSVKRQKGTAITLCKKVGQIGTKNHQRW